MDVVADFWHRDLADGQTFGDDDVDAQLGDDLAGRDVDDVLVHAQTALEQLLVRQVERHLRLGLHVDRNGELVRVSSAVDRTSRFRKRLPLSFLSLSSFLSHPLSDYCVFFSGGYVWPVIRPVHGSEAGLPPFPRILSLILLELPPSSSHQTGSTFITSLISSHETRIGLEMQPNTANVPKS